MGILRSPDSPAVAYDILQKCGAPIGGDFHKLDSVTVDSLLTYANIYRYRKPKTANGSRGRYWHDRLQRLAARCERAS